MITTKTVLVLGAGASQPYGFPTGSVLVPRLQSVGVAKQLERAGVTVEEFKRFSEVLGAAQLPSIDDFLEKRPEFWSIGTMAITACLLPAEHESLKELNDLSKSNHWYRYLKGHLSSPFQDLGKNQLRIITFNYDRSFEHYLFTTSRHTYGKSEEECVIQLAPIEILHVYGSLGSLPCQQATGSLPYGPADVTGRVIIQASQNIQIIHEGIEDIVQRNWAKAQKWLQWAERIVFLGFGFHPENLTGLGLELNDTLRRRRKRLFATGRGLGQRRRELEPFITFPDPEADCYTLLHDHVGLS